MRLPSSLIPCQRVKSLGRELGYWTSRLEPLGLVPNTIDGRAEVQIGAFQARWMGIAFREAIVVVAASAQADSAREAFHFEQAYNTNRFFAFVERVRFKTPYRHARIDVRLDGEPGFEIDADAGQRVRAHMGAGREPLETIDVVSDAVAHLPRGGGLHFFALIESRRDVFAADPATDRFETDALPGHGPLGCLVESDFRPYRWQIGRSAKHARSKTFRATADGAGAG